MARKLLTFLAVLLVSAATRADPLPCGSPPFTFTDEGDTDETESLRWAVGCANAEPGSDPIAINCNVASPTGITISSPLELDRDNVTIDCTTQAGTVLGPIPAPAIVITGAVTGDCLQLNGANITLLSVRVDCDTTSAALSINGDGATVKSSIFGDEDAALAVKVTGDNATIGGPDPEDRNIIRLANVDGIHSTDSDGLWIENNLIADVFEDGIFLGNGTSLTNATIRENDIVGNGLGTGSHAGIALGSNVSGVDIIANRCGIDASGDPAGNAFCINANPSNSSATGVGIDSNTISASVKNGIVVGANWTSVSVTNNLVGTDENGDEAQGYCNGGLPQINDLSGSATVTGNTVADCQGCCVMTCNPGGLLGAVDGGYCLDTDTGYGTVGSLLCSQASTGNCSNAPPVRFVERDTCGGGCAAIVEGPTNTPAPSPTPTPVDMSWGAFCAGECEITPAPAPTAKHVGVKTLGFVLQGLGVEGELTCRACAGCPMSPLKTAERVSAGAHVFVTEQACAEYGARISRCDGNILNLCQAQLFITK